MLEKLKNKKLLFGAVAVVVLAIVIPFTLSLVSKTQENRSHASGEAVSVVLDPLTLNVNLTDQLGVNVKLNAGQNDVSAIDITYTYDPNILTLVDFSPPTASYTTITNDISTPGTVHYVGINPTSSHFTGTLGIGVFTFKPKTTGTTTLGFSNIHINAAGVASALPVDSANTKIGTYTIVTSGATNTTPTTTASTSPTIAPTVAAATVTPLPTVADSATKINVSLLLTGIGSDSARGLNNIPNRPQRIAQAQILNSQNQPVFSTNGNVTYDATAGQYKGSLSAGTIDTGNYLIKVRMDNTLWKLIPGIYTITKDTVNPIPATTLISGDVNGDNEINLLDYSLMISCINKSGTCASTVTTQELNNLVAYFQKGNL